MRNQETRTNHLSYFVSKLLKRELAKNIFCWDFLQKPQKTQKALKAQNDQTSPQAKQSKNLKKPQQITRRSQRSLCQRPPQLPHCRSRSVPSEVLVLFFGKRRHFPTQLLQRFHETLFARVFILAVCAFRWLASILLRVR